MLALLRQRNFALLWRDGLISMLGDWILMIFNYPALSPVIWPAILFFVLAGFPVVCIQSALQTLMQSLQSKVTTRPFLEARGF